MYVCIYVFECVHILGDELATILFITELFTSFKYLQ